MHVHVCSQCTRGVVGGWSNRAKQTSSSALGMGDCVHENHVHNLTLSSKVVRGCGGGNVGYLLGVHMGTISDHHIRQAPSSIVR